MSGQQSSWKKAPFHFQQMSQHVHRLNMPWNMSRLLPVIPVAVFLVSDATGAYHLIDTGTVEMEEMIMSALGHFFDRDYNNTDFEGEHNSSKILSNLSSVCLTHFHHDHAGSLRQLWERSERQLPVYCHEEEIPFVQDGRKFKQQESHNWLFSIGRKILPSPTIEVPCKPLRSLLLDYHSQDVTNHVSSADRIDKHLQFFHCPGHTPGHCAFCVANDEVLLAGDAFMNVKGKLEGSPLAATPNPAQAKDSSKKLCMECSFTTLLPSHDSNEGVNKEDVLSLVNTF